MKWSEKQVKFLKENYPNGQKDYLCKMLGRSWTTIVHKASVLGVKRDAGSSHIDSILDNIEKHKFLGKENVR